MTFDSATHNRLMERYRALPPEIQAILILCAVIYEPVTEIMLYQIIRKLPVLFPGITSFSMLPPILRRLLQEHLIDLNFRCAAEIIEPITREGSSGKVVPVSDFEEMARILAENFPPSDSFSFEDPILIYFRVMRDFRIAIYTNQAQQCRELYPRVLAIAAETGATTNPFLEVVCRPFDPEWFHRLPAQIRSDTLFHGLKTILNFLEPVPGLLAYARAHSELFRDIRDEDRIPLQFLFLSLLLVDLRTDEVKNWLDQWKNFSFTSLIRGWIFFLEGNPDESVQHFQLGIDSFVTETGKNHFVIESIGGLVFVLSLLASSQPASREHLKTIFHKELSEQRHLPALDSSLSALKAIYLFQGHDNPYHTAPGVSPEWDTLLGIDILFWSLAVYRQEGRLNPRLLERLKHLFQKARQAELSWIAAECADLLVRMDEPGPDWMAYLKEIESGSGFHPVLVRMLSRNDWQKRLSAIIRLLETCHPSTIIPGSTRMIWVIQMEKGAISILPKEQKFLPTGQWSVGKGIPVNRLMTRKPENLTPQDLRICAAIRSVQNPFHPNSYEFDLDLALPALIGHPLVFLDGNPPVPIDLISGEPEAIVHAEEDQITLRMFPVCSDSRVKILPDSSTRFRIIRLKEEQLRLARILTENGLTVPINAKAEVLRVQAGISQFMTVHSNLSDKNDPGEHPETESHTCFQISPSGSGFQVRAVFRPLGREGPTVIPGMGPHILLRHRDGKCHQVIRNLTNELRQIHALIQRVKILSRHSHTNFEWKLTEPTECLDLLSQLRPFQQQNEISLEWPEGHRLQVTREISAADCRFKIVSKQNWFELTGNIQIDNQVRMDIASLFHKLLENKGSRFIPLEDGLFLALSRQLADMLYHLAERSDPQEKRAWIHPIQISDWLTHFPNTDFLEFEKPAQIRIQNIQKVFEMVPEIPKTLQATLRDYQREGYRWLSRMAFCGLGACLADDMGLGKTLQVLTLLLSRSSEGPALVIAPASVCHSWQQEASQFTPSLRLIQLGGKNREQIIRNLVPGDVLLISYGLLSQETDLLKSITWNTIVLDEAQVIKNISAKRSRSAMKLKGDFRVLTTGTPIENHPGEIYTLFQFLNPGLLGSACHFRKRFLLPGKEGQLEESLLRLKKNIRPFILRRMKFQVLTELPPKTEVVWTVDLSEEEMIFYELLRQESLRRIETNRGNNGMMQARILAEITRLRMACCDSRLVTPDSHIPSTKLTVLENLIDDLLENQHRILIFSQFVRFLKQIRSRLMQKNIAHQYLDGSVSLPDRKKEIIRFQQGYSNVFLISLKAGGLGLNLASANYVILMDPWWNPAVEDQASDRAHRLGQTQPVTIYRLISRHTIEEKILTLHRQKRDLAENLLKGDNPGNAFSVRELLRLIRQEPEGRVPEVNI